MEIFSTIDEKGGILIIYREVLDVIVEIHQNISRDCVSNICSGNADFGCYVTLHHNRRFSKVSATFVFVMKSF
jgi:hypothetical protein